MKKNFAKIFDTGENKVISILKFCAFLFTRPGFVFLKKIVKKYLHRPRISKQPDLEYNDWIKAQLSPGLDELAREKNIAPVTGRPKISILIVTPVSKNEYPEAAISSVINQSYGNLELCIAVSSGASYIKQKDDRIREVLVADNISIASCLNILLSTSTGSYILFMMHNDLLARDCLFEVLKHIDTLPADALIYTDEDIVDDMGIYSTPHFKPDWSPDSLLSRNYIGHTIIIKKEFITKINGFCEGFEKNDFYDLLLRAAEQTNDIGHIPKVLFHCKPAVHSAINDSTAMKALEEATTRRETPAIIKVVQGSVACYSLKYKIKKMERVSIIIPTKDNTPLLKKTVDSIIQKTDYTDYEIIVLNNNNTSHEFFSLIKEYEKKYSQKFRCVDANFPFNFSRLMNLGVLQSNGDYVLFCNDDIEVIHNDWMAQMVSYVQHNKTGAVGVKLLYHDNTIQHAGIILGIDGASGHAFMNKDRNDNGYFHCLKTTTNYSAVTAACMMCRKDVYDEVGGMDETLEVEYNDLDLCLKLLKKGYYNLYIPTVELYHYESATRGHPFRSKASWEQHEKDLAVFKRKWHPLISNDPFYNPNLTREKTDFSLRAKA